MITPLPGPVPAELTRYLTGHPDWARQQVHRGFQVWAHTLPDGRQDAWCSVPVEAGYEDEDRDDCDRAAFTVARVELGLGSAPHNYREAVRRLADVASAESIGTPGQAGRIAAGEFRVIYDTTGRARGLASQEEYARWERGMTAVRKSRQRKEAKYMTPREFVAAMIERGVTDARLDDPGCMVSSHPYGTISPGRIVFLGREGGAPCIYDPDEPLPRTVFVEVASEDGETLLAYDDVTVTGALIIITRLVREENLRMLREALPPATYKKE